MFTTIGHSTGMTGKEPFSYCADVHRFRGIAIALVVFSHVLAISKNDPVGNVLHESTTGSTWPFVFISGYLFALLHGKYDYIGYLRSKARNVFLPYVLIVSLTIALGMAGVPAQSAGDVFRYYLVGHTAIGPLWFIPMILLFFCAFPLFAWLYRRPELLVMACVGFIAIAMFKGRPHPFSGAIFNALYFASAYLFGMTYHRFQAQIESFVVRYRPIVILTLLVGIKLGMNDNGPVNQGWILGWLPLCVLMLPALRAASPLNEYFEWLGDRAFGIFFLHGLVTDRLLPAVGIDNHVVVGLAAAVVVTVGSGLVVSCFRAALGARSRLLIGS